MTSATAFAGTIQVKNEKDSGKGSLRKAIADAQAGDTVAVPKGEYRLTSGPLEVATAIEVKGAGAKKTVIDGQKSSRVFNVIAGVSPAKFTKLTVTGGKAEDGAGISNDGDLTLDHVLVTKNRASQSGGGIETQGPLTLVESEITRNRAKAGEDQAFGGGIATNGSVINVSQSTIAKNKVTSNGEATYGGAIYFSAVDEAAGLFIDRSTIAGNSAKGLGAYGGGVYFEPVINTGGAGAIDLMITQSTLSGNKVEGPSNSPSGGAVYFAPIANGALSSSSFILENSTVANNLVRAPGDHAQGGGLHLAPLASSGAQTPQAISNSTIAGNVAEGDVATGGGINFGLSGGIPTAKNTIVANNEADTGVEGCSSGLASLQGNLERGMTCGFNEPNDVGDFNPKLSALDDRGGETQTMGLPANSPAVDSAYGPNCLPIDQRGTIRPQGTSCDVGAFEREQ
jgi:hypothetical protein